MDIKRMLNGKASNAEIQFYCGKYFGDVVTAHPKFEELKTLFWEMEKRQYKRFSKTKKARNRLVLTNFVSEFFSNPNLENNPKVIALQKEILGDWGRFHSYFGVDIQWHKVFKTAYKTGEIVKTPLDYAKVVSLQDIPRY